MNPRVRQRVEEVGPDMTRSVRQRVEEYGTDMTRSVIGDQDVAPEVQGSTDWTCLTNDTMLHVFTLLDNRDRASLASTCTAWRSLGASPYLWSSLDLRSYKFDLPLAASLANRCADLQKVRFRDLHSPAALVSLKANNLREISGEGCENVTDVMLSTIVAHHKALESLQLGPGFSERITSEAIKIIAMHCPKLKSLRLSGMRDVSSDAIISLAQNCPQLRDVGFLDCPNINEEALGQVVSLRYLAVTGTSNINWRVATESWEKLPNLTGLDVSRTNVDHVAVSRLLTSSKSLKVVCALNCTVLENDANFAPDGFKGKIIIARFNNNLNGMASMLFEDSKTLKEETMLWLEWNLSCTLLHLAENDFIGLESFWNNHGPKLFLRLMQSSQEDVQERAATGLAAFIHMGDDNTSTSVMRDGGITILLKLAQSWKESFQSEAAKAIANLSLNDNAAKAVAEEGGVNVLLGLVKSTSRLVAQEAAGALWHLSLGDAYKAIVQAGGVTVLIKLLSRWPYDCGQLLERVAGALANLAGDDKCSREIAKAGGVHSLVMLARNCKYKGAQEHAARGLANLAAHDDSNNNNAAKAVAEEGGVDVLLGLAKSTSILVAHEAAGALLHLSLGDAYKAIVQAGGVKVLIELLSRWPYDCGELLECAAGALANLAGDKKCSREIAKAGGVHALVMLARNCKYNGAQEHAARGLANLAAHDDSNSNNASIGKEPRALETIIQLTRSCHSGVKREAAGALWNLAYDENNRGLIAALGGVEASVALANSCLNTTRGLKKSAAGALWCLSHSEENSIVIGREGGIRPLVTLSRSQIVDVHEAAAGALWNLSSNHVNALSIVEEGGVLALGRLCTTSPSKMARFLAALTLAFIVDGRLDECVKASPGERTSKSVRLAKVRISALKYIERFTKTFMDPEVIKTAASSFTPSKSAQLLKSVCIPEADNLRCSGEEIGRFVKMLRNLSPVLQNIAAFALLQFTIPGASHAKNHASLMQNAGYPRLLRFAAAATSMPREAKIFAKVVLRNLEYHQPECSKGDKLINFQIGFGRLFQKHS